MDNRADFLRVEPPKDSLRLRVADVLRRSILEDHFSPGEHLIERELCELTGVGRTILREALRHLESEGLLETIPNRGLFVATLSVEDALQIYQVRESLESLAARLFTVHASDQDIESLESKLALLHEAHKSKSFSQMVDATQELYKIILQGCGNTYLSAILQRLQTRVGFLRLRSISLPGRRPEGLKEVERIVLALIARDAEEASGASVIHTRNACKAAVAALSVHETSA